jgi:hypothetical protein
LRNKITEIKNPLEEPNSRLTVVQERISKYTSTEIIQPKEERVEKRIE